MKDEKNDNDENLIDLKGTIENFIEGETPELSQEEAIKAYRDEVYISKNKRNIKNDEDDIEDDEHLKRVKQELLESIKKVDAMAKQIFEDKENLKKIKIKDGKSNQKNYDEIMNKMRENIEKDQERSRGE